MDASADSGNEQNTSGVTTTDMPMELYIAHQAHVICMTYIDGLFVWPAIVLNILTAAVFSQPDAAQACGRTTRLYYVVISILDCVNVIDMQLVVSFLDYGLEYLTGGAFHPGYIQRMNDLMCKIWWYPYFVTEQLSGFVLFTFSVERLYAVYRPMRVRQMWTYQRVRVSLVGLTLAVCLWNVHIILSIKRLPTKGSTSYQLCQPDSGNAVEVVLFWIAYGILNYGLPTVLVFLINLCIIFRLFVASKHRSLMMTSEQSSAEAMKQRVATASVLLLAIVHVCMFVPAAIIMTMVALGSIGLLPFHETNFAALIEYGYLVSHLAVLPKAANFFVYYARVPYFSAKIRTWFFSCCRKAKSPDS